jgi:hypothetical protein
MELTVVVAVVGAATGLASLVIQLVGARHERSRLRLEVTDHTIIGRKPRIEIDVFNDSPRATTVRQVGLYAHPVRISHRSGQNGRVSDGIAEIDFPFNDQPFFMEAGEVRRFAGAPDFLSHGIHADAPLRVYAVDARNRRVWGAAAPFVRHMLGSDPPIDAEDERTKRLIRPDGIERSPWPVESRWKLWKRRELRRSTSESRQIQIEQKAAGGTLRVRGGVIKFDPEEASRLRLAGKRRSSP